MKYRGLPIGGVVSIREAGLEDIEIVMAIERACFNRERYSREILESMLAEDYFTVLLAEEGEVLGSAAICHGKEGTQIISLGVLPRYRGRGIASALMDEIEERALARGNRRLVLQVSVINVAAMNLYLRRGFVLQGILKDYYGRRRDAYLMDKILERV